MKGRWQVIDEWLDDPRIGVEVGVKEGRFISYLLSRNPQLTMYAVDPWEDQPDGNETYLEWNWTSIYQAYQNNTSHHRDRIIEIRDYSEKAAPLVDDMSLDFVFIDAQHDYDSVKKDIELWAPKVKLGGLMSGHDYQTVKFPGVVQAVHEAFDDVKLGDNDVWGTII